MHDQPGNISKSEAYANDFTTPGILTDLKVLWNISCDLGPKFGHYPLASNFGSSFKK